MRISSLRYAAVALLATFGMMSAPVWADSNKDAKAATPKKHDYQFSKFKSTPTGIAIYGPAFFGYNSEGLYNLRGGALAVPTKTLINVDVDPMGSTYVAVGANKKDNEAAVYENEGENKKKFNLKRKQFGNPSYALFTPDLKNFAVATDKGLMLFDRRTREFVDSIALPYANVTEMVISPNCYYAAVTDGRRVTVYNLESKKPRQSWDFEVKVNDMAFNNTSSEFAVATEDGLVNIYDTRNFMIKKDLDDLGEANAISYNTDGKYLAVATTPSHIQVVNLLDPADRETIGVLGNVLSTVRFIKDLDGTSLMAYNSPKTLNVRRMDHLKPYFGRLIQDEANERLNEWLKKMPDETMEEYQARVNDESRARQLRLYEEEAATRMAPDMLSMASIDLGSYDRGNGVLEVGFDNMPPIYLPVPESDLASFNNVGDLEFRNAKYGVTADDKFELIYAEVYNRANGKNYTYNNIDRTPLNFMSDADNVVSITLIQQQQMEELRLQEMREQVMEEAKSENVISDHTNISVNSRIIPDYDADGNKILNYNVKFAYEVEPGFTAVEDFDPGKYRAEQSGAASSMLKLVNQALGKDLAQYVKAGKKLKVVISGTADATPIVSNIIYDGSYGDIVDEPVYDKDNVSSMTIHPKDRITENQQLAFLRAYGVKNFLTNNNERLADMNTDYRYDINVTEGKGSEFRRITVDFTFVDAY